MRLCDARILVVEDEVALREIFANWMRRAGCTVITAAHGQEAVDALEGTEVDVMVTDVRMPVMDGVTLVRRLAALGKHIPCIIFVSAFGDVDQREMYNLGVESFLAKPFRLEELQRVLHQALAEREELWKERLAIAPRQSLELSGWLGAEDDPMAFKLGRGGFRARALSPAALGKVQFRCSVSSAPPDEATLVTILQGEGFVRWRSRSDTLVGVELAYLEEPGRSWVLERMAAELPQAFIPG
jgi:CheY-like chemotaxis protein